MRPFAGRALYLYSHSVGEAILTAEQGGGTFNTSFIHGVNIVVANRYGAKLYMKTTQSKTNPRVNINFNIYDN